MIRRWRKLLKFRFEANRYAASSLGYEPGSVRAGTCWVRGRPGNVETNEMFEHLRTALLAGPISKRHENVQIE